MNLTEKGLNALNQARTHFPHGYFSAAELSAKCGEKIVAATLNGVVTKGYMEKIAGTPVKYCLVDNIEELIANDTETKGANNKKLQKAKKEKHDEFYTFYQDINNELMNYRKHFKNKSVFCNCNDGLTSNFFRFFLDNFDAFQLTRLVGISYSPYSADHKAVKYEVYDDINHDGYITEDDVVATELVGDGSFTSEESLAELEKCDIVCTNPPFSAFREYMSILFNSHKKFLVLGNNNAITYKDMFPKIRDNEMWLGCVSNKTLNFFMPDEYESDTLDKDGRKIGKVPAISWFTNIPTPRREEPLVLTATYYDDTNRKEEYPTYDNYDAIEVSKVVNIPKDYMGVMGVPITFLDKHCPEQFEVLGHTASCDTAPEVEALRTDPVFRNRGRVDGKEKYDRILIRRVK